MPPPIDPLPIVVLTGPTTSGKSELALRLATRSREGSGGIEIINADSLLVYRHLNIGTAKPSPEELARVPHHLIDIREPDETFTAGDFVRTAKAAIDDIESRGKRALVVGGTGFYLHALLFGLWGAPPSDPRLRASLATLSDSELYLRLSERDPATADRVGANDRYRLIRALEIILLSGKTPSEFRKSEKKTNPRFRLWVIDRNRSELHDRIHLRTIQLLQKGLVEEVQEIRTRFPNARPLGSVGYAQVCASLDGLEPPGRKSKGVEGLQEEIELATRQLVKKQRTWFKGRPEAKWFLLDRDLGQLENEFAEIYGGQSELQGF